MFARSIGKCQHISASEVFILELIIISDRVLNKILYKMRA